jgi:hypothetical protein
VGVLTLGDYAFDGHFAADGRRDPFGGTRAESLWVEGIYALTDRLARADRRPRQGARNTVVDSQCP